MPTIIDKPASTQAAPAPTNHNTGARERAIAALSGNQGAPGQSQATPVQNPNSISPEEMGALGGNVKKDDESGQNNRGEPAEASDAKPTTEATDPKADETSEESKQPLSAQYAQLARKEKAIRSKAQELRAKEVELKQREEALKSPTQAVQQTAQPQGNDWKERLQKDPLRFLAEQGLDYNQLTELQANAPSPEGLRLQTKVESLENELKALRDEAAKARDEAKTQQTEGYKQALNQIRNETKRLVAADDNYETIRASGAEDDVVELIERTFNEDGYLMTVDEAAQAVEEHLVEEAIKFTKLKKIQSRLSPKAPEPTAPKTAAQPPEASKQQPQMKTLTHNMGTSRPMTAKERAIAAFKGELK